MLKQADEAEDCFQAVFLVLLRKAATIDPTKQLANWLYGVAYRTALKARALSSKRRSREKQVMHVPEPTTMPDDSAELLQLLDQELSRLPEKYRVPILLCELPGKSYKEAADSLGISPGALSVRLVRARGMLAKRLARHGLAVSIGLLSLILIKSAARMSAPLLAATVQLAHCWATGQVAAAGMVPAQVEALAEGMLKTMLLKKLHKGNDSVTRAERERCGLGGRKSALGRATAANRSSQDPGKSSR